MSDPIKITNQNGSLVGKDPETGEKVPIEFEEIHTRQLNNVIHTAEYEDIDSAFADFPESGRHVHVDAEGPLKIENPPIEIDDPPILLTGDGWDDRNEEGSFIKVTEDASALKFTPSEYFKGISIKEVGFLGPGQEQSTSTGLELGKAHSPYLERVVVDGFGNAGIRFGGAKHATYGTLIHCWSLHNKRGLSLRGNNLVKVFGGRYNFNESQGIYVSWDVAHGTKLYGVDMSANGTGFDLHGVDADDLVLQGCWMEQNEEYDVRIRPESGSPGHVFISGKFGSDVENDNLSFGEGGCGQINQLMIQRVRGNGTIRYGPMVSQVMESFVDPRITIAGERNPNSRVSMDANGLQFTGDDTARPLVVQKPTNDDVEFRTYGRDAISVFAGGESQFVVSDDSENTINFEGNQLKNPDHTILDNDDIRTDLERGNEDGYLTVNIDGTPYQIPMYSE